MTAPHAPLISPSFVPVGDHGLLIEFGTEISDRVSDAVLGASRAIDAAAIPGLVEIVPAFVNLLVVFDPMVVDHQTMHRALVPVLHAAAQASTGGRHHPATRTIEVCYDLAFGTDLAAVAEATGHSVEAVIERHCAAEYRLCMYGFQPGYAYLSGVPADIQVPRKPVAVRDVAAGSVIIAGPQSLVTTLRMPTGWSVLGRSPTPILQDDPDEPVRFDLGDRVQFVPIDLPTYERRLRS